MSKMVRTGRIGSPRPASTWVSLPASARSGGSSSPARITASTRWPKPASMRTVRKEFDARATPISGSRTWTATGSTPRSSSASSASPHGSATPRRPTRCCAFITTGSEISAAIIPTARSALPVCLMATSTRRSRRFTASPSSASKVSSSPALGTWSRCGSPCGRRSTMSSSRCISTLSRRPRRGARQMASSQTRRAAQFTGVAGFQMNLINIIAAIIGAGVLERYPNLRIGLGESGIGWLPYALDRMDFEYEDRFRDLMKLKPNDYLRRQCRATFQFDRIGAKLVKDIGVETLMWGSDYPHPDGVWPESSKYIAEQFAGLSPEVVHKITCENAGKFYGLIN